MSRHAAVRCRRRPAPVLPARVFGRALPSSVRALPSSIRALPSSIRALASVFRAVPRTLLVIGALAASLFAPPAHAAAPMPVLRWAYGGCYALWCETGWYASPVVADTDLDGTVEVWGATYTIVALDANDGTLRWRLGVGQDRSALPTTSARTWPDLVLADIDGDGSDEIATAHAGGVASAYTGSGYFKPGWPFTVAGGAELRGLAAADLDHDGARDLVLTRAGGAELNAWSLQAGGTVRGGWPQKAPATPGYAWGIYNGNATIGDLDGSGTATVVLPSDVHYACAYTPAGAPRPASLVFGAGSVDGSKAWGEIGFWESPVPELRGYGLCDGTRLESYRANLAQSPGVIADLDGSGIKRFVLAGDLGDCSTSESGLGHALFILGADRTRLKSGPWDWSYPAVGGRALSLDFTVIQNAMPNPVVADLDGDGVQEILVPSYDGKLHAWWLDHTEHGGWPVDLVAPRDGYLGFPGEPLVVDLDADGKAEVIVATWTAIGSGANGRILILDDRGAVLRQLDLPAPRGGMTWNGALAAPTLARLAPGGDLLLVLQTAGSGLVAYDLPGTANARVLWGTGRWNVERTGACSRPTPGEVAGLLITKSAPDALQFAWTAQAAASRYDVVSASVPQLDAATFVGQSAISPLTVPGAQSAGGAITYYRARASNSCGIAGR